MTRIDDQRAEAGQLVTWACIVVLHQRHAITQKGFAKLADYMVETQEWLARETAKGQDRARLILAERAAMYCEERFGFPGNYKRTRSGQILREELTGAASMAWQLMVISIVGAFGYKRKALMTLKEEVREVLQEICDGMYAKTEWVREGSGFKRAANREWCIERLAMLVSDALGEEVRIVDEGAWQRTAIRLNRITRAELDKMVLQAAAANAKAPAGQPYAVMSIKSKLKAVEVKDVH